MSLKKTTNQTEALTQAQVVLMETEVISRLRTPDEFRLVNNQYNALQSWHDQYTGWRIRRSPAVIRLIRTPTTFIPGYAFRTLQQPRDFACFVWTLWYAESRLSSGRGNEQQFLMSGLAERLEEHSGGGYLAPHVAALDFKRQADRYSLSRALKTLQDLGGLQLVDGSTEEWVNNTGQENALWEFTEVARSLILALDMSQVNGAGKVLDGNPHTLAPARLPEADRLNPLQRAWRTLLLGPALFKYDDPTAFAALQAHHETVSFELGATFGWQLDLRQEYAMVIRAGGTSHGPRTLLNLTGAADQAALLCCSVIRRRVDGGDWPYQSVEGCYVVPQSEVADIFRQLREQYGHRWGNTARKLSFNDLLQDVYASLRQAGLVRGPDRQGNLLILPTVARFAVSYPPELDDNDNEETPAAQLSFETTSQADLSQHQVQTQTINHNGSATSGDPFTASQVGRRLGVSDQTVLNWIKKGLLRAERNERGWAIPASEVARFEQTRQADLTNTSPPFAPLTPPPVPPTASSTGFNSYEAARLLGVADQTILNWIKKGVLKAEKRDQHWSIPPAEIERVKNLRINNN